MTKKLEIYKCEICGNIVEVLHEGAGQLVCCGKPMNLLEEKKIDEGNEKHVPVSDGNKIKIGSVQHPMQENHYIEWIEVISNNNVERKFLNPNDAPEAEFNLKGKARAYCNIHGLWSSY